MDITAVHTEIETALHHQLALSADDSDITEAASALIAVLEPSLRQAVTTLAEQAALEAAAQLPEYHVSVVLSGGEPQLRVQPEAVGGEITSGGNEARLTLRLPESLKRLLEQAAMEVGDSVNSYVVNSLAAQTKRAKAGRGNHIRTSIDL